MINDNQLSLNVILITGDPFVKKISRQVQYSWSFGCQMLKSEGQWRNWSFGCLISKNGNNNADKYNILGLLNVKCWILENRRQKICVQWRSEKTSSMMKKSTQELEFYTLQNFR